MGGAVPQDQWVFGKTSLVGERVQIRADDTEPEGHGVEYSYDQDEWYLHRSDGGHRFGSHVILPSAQ